MKKFNLFLLLLLLFPTIYFTSCAEEEEEDNELPVIVYAHINVNDTLYSIEDNTSIKLNDSTNIKHEIDTVVVGKWLYVNTALSDKGRGLSTFKVETNLLYKYEEEVPADEPKEKYQDSILKIVKLGRNIFGKDSVIVNRNRLVQIPESIIRNYDGGIVKLNLVTDDYPMKLVCLDIVGNRDSITFPVRYVRRNVIYESR